MSYEVSKSDDEWREELGADKFAGAARGRDRAPVDG